jgi:cytochrome bd-type quinol oxidase subunit 2
MGDPDKYEYVSGNDAPYLEATDAEGYSVEISEAFDAEIVSWEYPEPVENSFKFVGISRLHAISMASMLAIAILTIIACMIFVRKEKDLHYKALDVVSIVANFIIAFMVIPFITIAVFFLPIVMDSGSLMYQIYLCIPALTAFTIAASVALRRKGFAMSGFFVQLAFPVLFFAEIIIESVIDSLLR